MTLAAALREKLKEELMAACGEPTEVTTTSWHLCWTWHGPWLCKKTTVEGRYAYVFAILRRRDRGFTSSYRACCELAAGEFTWTAWTWRLYWNPPDQYNVSRNFAQQLITTGPCGLGVGLSALPRQD
jgi:hypothetical protein